jgi:protein-S-isoprenylcysteine O-methyltransferase Ste14
MHWTQIFLAASLICYLVVFATVLFLVRRSAGANPRGHDGGRHLAALLNSLASLLLLVTAAAYPLDARTVTWFGRISLLDHLIFQAAGVATMALSGLCLVWGSVSLGSSFRVALPERRQPLVTHGIYRFARNPLALSANLLALCVLLMAPSWLAAVSFLLNAISYEWKIRIEEAYLRQAHGAAYANYCSRTGRYLPRLFQRHR